ncbi:hypothetical protein EMMF5_006506 [Cystobasidiomycetes sp. EMM_F5]
MFLGWFDVRRDFKRILRTFRNGELSGEEEKPKVEAYPDSRIQRLMWVASAYTSIQLNGWLVGNKSHDAKQLENTRNIVTFKALFRHVAFKCALYYCMLEAIYHFGLVTSNPNFVKTANASFHEPSVLGNALSLGSLLAYLYAALALYTYYVPMMLALIASYLVPSLRSHQTLSPLIIAPYEGPFTAIWRPTSRRRTWGLRAFWGGIIHMGMIPPFPLYTNVPAMQLRLLLATFFWLQPIGVLLETVVDGFFRKMVPAENNSHDSSRAVSKNIDNQAPHLVVQLLIVVWTCAFMSYVTWTTGRIVGREMGWWNLHASPVSIVSMLRGEADWCRKWL